MDTQLITVTAKTDQEAFDTIVRHLAGMRERALLPEDRWSHARPACAYETEDGKSRCAIGVLLVLDTPAKHAWARGVKAGVDSIAYDGYAVRDDCRVDFGDLDPALLDRMQNIHDDSGNWSPAGFQNWDAVAEAGSDYELDLSAIPNK